MCDDACIALSTRTQLEHDETGGVVPEVAARSHANAIFPCIEDALRDAQITLSDIDYIACTREPGLMPSLLTGMTVAQTLSLSLKKPLIWIHHIESHIFANLLERKLSDFVFPSVVLTVSGGHTEIYIWKSLFELEMVGQTRDDAAWECFDKVAKMMWLGFPGGAKLAKLASEYNWGYQGIFPEVLLEKESLDFSFSWIKTAVKREIDNRIKTYWSLTHDDIAQISYEFEETVTNILSKKLIRAAEKFAIKNIILAGWVSANSKLRSKLQDASKIYWYSFFSPVKNLYSMDNAAMVGIRAWYELQKNS
jgi:N6-L-threonylcarbamoyladenine synthase